MKEIIDFIFKNIIFNLKWLVVLQTTQKKLKLQYYTRQHYVAMSLKRIINTRQILKRIKTKYNLQQTLAVGS